MKIYFLLAGLLVLGLTSCESQRAITQPQVNRIRPGLTTEADLVQLFGQPDTKLTSFEGWSSLSWFRSLGPNPAGYVGIFGDAFGGLNLEVQQVQVILGETHRVRSYTLYDSNGAVKTERTRNGTTRDVAIRK